MWASTMMNNYVLCKLQLCHRIHFSTHLCGAESHTATKLCDTVMATYVLIDKKDFFNWW